MKKILLVICLALILPVLGSAASKVETTTYGELRHEVDLTIRYLDSVRYCLESGDIQRYYEPNDPILYDAKAAEDLKIQIKKLLKILENMKTSSCSNCEG